MYADTDQQILNSSIVDSIVVIGRMRRIFSKNSFMSEIGRQADQRANEIKDRMGEGVGVEDHEH